VVSSLTALVAVIVSPLITWWQTKKHIAVQKQIANRQILAPLREAWISNLRGKLAEFEGKLLHLRITNERSDEAVRGPIRDFCILQAEITLLLNPAEDDHRQLSFAISKLVTALDDNPNDFLKKTNDVEVLAQKVLRAEWNRVKDPDGM